MESWENSTCLYDCNDNGECIDGKEPLANHGGHLPTVQAPEFSVCQSYVTV